MSRMTVPSESPTYDMVNESKIQISFQAHFEEKLFPDSLGTLKSVLGS